MTEYASPAEISLIEAPSRKDCFTFEFMNTVQRVQRSQGDSPLVASFANSAAVYPIERANDSMKEPHPEEQASLIFISWMKASFTKMAFISCPPMSMMKLTSLSNAFAAR